MALTALLIAFVGALILSVAHLPMGLDFEGGTSIEIMVPTEHVSVTAETLRRRVPDHWEVFESARGVSVYAGGNATYEDLAELLGPPLVVGDPADPVLSSQHVLDARAEDDGYGREQVLVVLTPEGGARFCEHTEAHVGEIVAIRVDGVVVSEPMVQEKICGGRIVISMGNSDESASDLASSVRNALPVPGSIGTTTTVSAAGPSWLGRPVVLTLAWLSLPLIIVGALGRRWALLVAVGLSTLTPVIAWVALWAVGMTFTLPSYAGVAVASFVVFVAILAHRIRGPAALGKSRVIGTVAGISVLFVVAVASGVATMVVTGPAYGATAALAIASVCGFVPCILGGVVLKERVL